MIAKLVLAAVVGTLVWLLCEFLGSVLPMGGAPLLTVVGNFLAQWGLLFGLLAALWYFFAGGPVTWPFRRP